MGLAKVLPEIPALKASYATGHMFRHAGQHHRKRQLPL